MRTLDQEISNIESSTKNTPIKQRNEVDVKRRWSAYKSPEQYSQTTNVQSLARNEISFRKYNQNSEKKESIHSSAISTEINNDRNIDNIEYSRSLSKDSKASRDLNFDMTFSNKFKSESKEFKIQEVEFESDSSRRQQNPFESSNKGSMIMKRNAKIVSSIKQIYF